MKSLLFILIAFIALTATLSGLLMISDPSGGILNLPLSLLEGTPFKDFRIPGILLTATAGGTNLLAVFFNMQRHPRRYQWAIAGGMIISLWIIAQVILIGVVHWLHILYLIIGLLIMLTAYQLKGKWAA
ncbi:MAG: hypothetical protein SFU87_20060 [Chitinophagaceae bacterium]|nr:hypothetical protein [Chitinophagaceae bacterium]